MPCNPPLSFTWIGRADQTERPSQISDILENIGESAIPYLHFVTNPDSFAQTVENMFYFSFLVKEGKASIELDDNEDSEHFGEYVACKLTWYDSGVDPAETAR